MIAFEPMCRSRFGEESVGDDSLPFSKDRNCNYKQRRCGLWILVQHYRGGIDHLLVGPIVVIDHELVFCPVSQAMYEKRA